MRRTTLSPLAAADLPAIEPWWAEAAATVRGNTAQGDADGLGELLAGSDTTLVIARAGERAPIGLLAYALPAKGWLEFRLVALAAGRRGFGHGSEAVREVEASWPASRFAADVHAANGLGLYFWLRLGYRPAAPGELPWREREPGDMITLVR
jgi:hypothetical protein